VNRPLKTRTNDCVFFYTELRASKSGYICMYVYVIGSQTRTNVHRNPFCELWRSQKYK
jgi:hypothetical protein